MAQDSPSETETEILLAFYRSSQRVGEIPRPTTKELAKANQVTPPAISQAKHRLKEGGYLTKGDRLTQKALKFLQFRVEVIPVEIPLIGEVQAGQRPSDQMVVYMSDLSRLGDPGIPRVTIPTSDVGATTVAFLVRGSSMEDHKIYDGDYVLIELYAQNSGPREGDLIVTYYLSPADSEAFDRLQDGVADNIAEEFMAGPTIKYYYSREDHYRLSPTINPDRHVSTIRTRRIRPVGRVIGVYRAV